MPWISWSKFNVYTPISTPYIQLYFIYQIVIMNCRGGSRGGGAIFLSAPPPLTWNPGSAPELRHRIGGVKIGVLATGKHTTFRRKRKDLLAQNSDNVSEWRDMPTHRLLSQWSSTIKIQFSGVQSRHHYHIIEFNLFSPWHSWKIAHLAFKNNHSLK